MAGQFSHHPLALYILKRALRSFGKGRKWGHRSTRVSTCGVMLILPHKYRNEQLQDRRRRPARTEVKRPESTEAN